MHGSSLVPHQGPEPQTEREYLIEVYRMLREVQAGLVAVGVLVEQQNGRLEEQNGRLGKLEQWQAWLMGALAVVGVVATAALGVALREVVAALLR